MPNRDVSRIWLSTIVENANIKSTRQIISNIYIYELHSMNVRASRYPLVVLLCFEPQLPAVFPDHSVFIANRGQWINDGCTGLSDCIIPPCNERTTKCDDFFLIEKSKVLPRADVCRMYIRPWVLETEKKNKYGSYLFWLILDRIYLARRLNIDTFYSLDRNFIWYFRRFIIGSAQNS